MNVLSLFDGISIARLALERANIPVDKYYASEIDKFAIGVSLKNFPDTIHLGDIQNWKDWNLNDPRGKLFFVASEIIKKYKPKYFLLENTVMKKEWQDIISKEVGVEPIMIDSARLSAQSRKRLYWTNIPDVTEPIDKKIKLSEVLVKNKNENKLLSEKELDYMFRTVKDGRNHFDFAHHSDANKDKSACVTANFYKGVPYNVLKYTDNNETKYRKLFPIECERLQTIPDDYTAGFSDTQRYKMIGNSFTTDVIAYILSFVKKDL